MNRPNLIFYSLNDNKCKNFYNYLIKNNLNYKFKLINVDIDNSIASKKINIIPTMIIPSINKVYYGDDVYAFFQNKNKINKSINNNQINNNKPINNNQINNNTQINNKQLNKNNSNINKLINNKQINNNSVNNKSINNKPINNIKSINNKPINEKKQQEIKEQVQENEILGYIDDEMSGLSDKYLLLNTNITPIHNYGIY